MPTATNMRTSDTPRMDFFNLVSPWRKVWCDRSRLWRRAVKEFQAANYLRRDTRGQDERFCTLQPQTAFQNPVAPLQRPNLIVPTPPFGRVNVARAVYSPN